VARITGQVRNAVPLEQVFDTAADSRTTGASKPVLSRASGQVAAQASSGLVVSENADGLLRPSVPSRHGLSRDPRLTVTSLVTIQHERRADLRESAIWIMTSCAPGKRLPPGPQQACDLREQYPDRKPAIGISGRRNRRELAIRHLIMPLNWGNRKSWS
jgi:hypothetical protein